MFSILTPTYNRSHILYRVYNSLIHQTFQEFEWIIIDDASSDNTQVLVKQWQNEGHSFNIHYHLLPKNKGKPNAINVGMEYCTQPITIIADSDDSFVPQTLTELRQIWRTVDLSEEAEQIAAVWTLVKNEQNQLVGDPFPSNFWQVNFKERVLDRKNLIYGEKWHSWRTNILKRYKMYHSEFSFISEGATWNRINKDYDFLCINIFHRTYYFSSDGLIQKKKTRLELEKIKYYNAYYQLYETPIKDIFANHYYHQYAFNYLKSIQYYKKRDVKLDFFKSISCYLLGIWHLPLRLKSYFSR